MYACGPGAGGEGILGPEVGPAPRYPKGPGETHCLTCPCPLPSLIQLHRGPQNSGPFTPGWGPTELEEAGRCPGHMAPQGPTQGFSFPHLEGCLCL